MSQIQDLQDAIAHGLAYYERRPTGTEVDHFVGAKMLRALRSARHILRHPEGDYLFSTRDWLQAARKSRTRALRIPIDPAIMIDANRATLAGLDVSFYTATPRGFQDEV